MREDINSFLARLNSLGNGERAALRRACGRMLSGADGKAVAAFYHCMPYGTPRWQENRWFAVACLRCLWNLETDGGEAFEKIVGQMKQKMELSDSIGHRLEALLDTVWDEDGYMLTKLTRLVKLIRQKSDCTMIDFTALLEDLIYWNAEDQSVQRKWARSFFANDI